jgi:hypothetical protein
VSLEAGHQHLVEQRSEHIGMADQPVGDAAIRAMPPWTAAM